mgnify:CR=1 FL=1
MKIVAGRKKGAEIFGPGPKKIRPMRQVVRRAMFDTLRNVVEGSTFLDLFAGTGSVGLEALSQGAESVTFVDNLHQAIQLINKNLEKLGFRNQASVLEMEVSRALDYLAGKDFTFDLVFVGPPYGEGLSKETLKLLSEKNIVRSNGIVVTEMFKKNELPAACLDFERIQTKNYGQSKLLFYRRTPRPSSRNG